MTAYNREHYIAEAIESVLASTYTNFELIIVDDASTDKTVEIAKGFADTDKRVKLYVNEKNLDQFPNRNKAASYAKGKYIKYCDSDDKIFDWTLAYCVETMEKYPDAGMGILHFQNEIQAEYLTSREAINQNFFQSSFLGIGPSGTIIKKEAFEKLGYFKPDYGVPSDLYFNLNMASFYPIVLLKKTFFFYRVHDGQELKNNYSYLCYNYKYLFDAFSIPGFPLTTKQKKYFLSQAKRSFVKQFFHYLREKRNLRKAIKAIKISGIGFKGFIQGIFNN